MCRVTSPVVLAILASPNAMMLRCLSPWRGACPRVGAPLGQPQTTAHYPWRRIGVRIRACICIGASVATHPLISFRVSSPLFCRCDYPSGHSPLDRAHGYTKVQWQRSPGVGTLRATCGKHDVPKRSRPNDWRGLVALAVVSFWKGPNTNLRNMHHFCSRNSHTIF